MSRLDRIDVWTWRDDYQWHACLREYDLGTKVFSGMTQREAINEMLDYYEQDDGSLAE